MSIRLVTLWVRPPPFFINGEPENILEVEDKIWRKTTFGGRQRSLEDDLQWKTTFVEGGTLTEDDPLWRATFGGRHPSVEDDLWW